MIIYYDAPNLILAIVVAVAALTRVLVLRMCVEGRGFGEGQWLLSKSQSTLQPGDREGVA